MQSKIFQTLLITATLGLGIPTENAHGSSCDTCVCQIGKNSPLPGEVLGELINTGFNIASGSCTTACDNNFRRSGVSTCYSTGVKVNLPTNIKVIDCSQSTNAHACRTT